MELENIMNVILEKGKITTKELNALGYNSKKIKTLLELGILNRETRGIYRVVSKEILYEYGIRLLKEKKFDKSISIFENCYQLDRNDYKINFILFYNYMVLNQKEKVFEYFDQYYSSCTKEEDIKNSNYYLLLLNYIYGAPKKYQDIISSMSYEDISVSTEEGEYTDIENKIRFNVSTNSFLQAELKMIQKRNLNIDFDIEDDVEQVLVSLAAKKQSNFLVQVSSLIMKEDFEELLKVLKENQKNGMLSSYDEAVLSVLNSYLNILDTSNIPIIGNPNMNTVFDCIRNNDFRRAFVYLKDSLDGNNCLEENDEVHKDMAFKNQPLYQILVKTNKLIDALSSADYLFERAKEKYIQKDYDCFHNLMEACYKLDSSHFGVNLSGLEGALYCDNSKDVLRYFDFLYEAGHNSEFLQRDVNFYLLLLSRIYPLPLEYQKILSEIKLEDILVKEEDNRYLDIKTENKIRMYCYENLFDKAKDTMYRKIKNLGIYTLEDAILKNAFNRLFYHHFSFINEMNAFIRDDKLEEAREYTSTKYSKVLSFPSDIYTIKLLDKYLKMKKEGKVPEIFESKFDDVYSLIEANDFSGALQSRKEYLDRKNSEKEKDTLYLLLEKTVEDAKKFGSKITLREAIDAIYSNRLEVVDNYLEQLGKSNYFFLVKDSILLAEMKDDTTFNEAVMALTQISQNDYQFDVEKYKHLFQDSIREKEYKQARVYLNIINRSKDLGVGGELVEGLMQILELTNQVDSKEAISKPVETNNTFTTNTVIEERASAPLEKWSKQEYNLVAEKVQKIYDGNNSVLFKPMDAERRKRIHLIVKEFQDVASFEVGSEDNCRVVLRYKPRSMEKLDLKKLSAEANQLYKEKKFKKCLEVTKQLLEVGRPCLSNYVRYGMCLLYLGSAREAITYLTIATELSKKFDEHLDFTNLIQRIKNNLVNGSGRPVQEEEEKKPNFKMTVLDFFDSQTFNINMDFIHDLLFLIEEENLSIEEAARRLNLTEEEINYVKLICARDCYYVESYGLGDEYLREVERSAVKSAKIKKLLQEVRLNKRFYKNRLNDGGECLILKR